jgi:hypothetical protein
VSPHFSQSHRKSVVQPTCRLRPLQVYLYEDQKGLGEDLTLREKEVHKPSVSEQRAILNTSHCSLHRLKSKGHTQPH